MAARFRSFSRVQKIGVGIVTFLLLCCGCTALISLVPSSSEDETTDITSEVAELVDTAEASQPEETTEPTDTPEPTNTPLPTNTPVPSETPTPEPQTSEITLESGEEISGTLATVTRIIDGDTIEVDINGRSHRVRYIGMDTPERGDPFFGEATEANRQLVEGQTVILVKDVSETDRYGRLLRYVYLQDGTFVNAELVRQGFALVATFPPDVAHQADYIALQEEARSTGSGLWSESNVVEAPTSTAVIQPTNTTAPQPTNTTAPLPTNTSQPLPTNTLAATQAPLPTNTSLPPTNTPEPVAAPGDVRITYIFFDGVEPQSEGDEYAVITNQGGTAVNMSGWRLNADDSGQDFWFPSFDLQPGQSCRVYTNQIQGDSCGGQGFGNGSALWANTGECGHLYDPSGVEVSNYCY
jgi:micrococcal nuclease